MTPDNQLRKQVLLVDDEEEILATSRLSLEMGGIRDIVALNDSREVLPHLEGNPVSVMVLDLAMPHLTGLELLEAVRRDFPQIPVIMVTANERIESAVACVKLGAFDYLTKPVTPLRLLTSVQKALEHCSLSGELSSMKERLLTDRLEHPAAFASIVTRNRQMRALFQYVEVVAPSPMPVIVTGDTGVGKELVARAIHDLSGRKGDYIALNAAGLDDSMFSDALFGHKRGAFTGADQNREGLIERAENGTLFLDEIGDLSEMSQVKLLRVLQEREYYPVGSDKTKKTSARFVLATNRDLQQRVKEGKFRQDLYYRLSSHKVRIPPLCERKDDLPLLLDHFIQQAAGSLGIAPPSYPKELLHLLETYNFPGNVRELQGMVMDAVARSKTWKLSQEPFRQAITADPGQNPQPGAPADEASLHKYLELIWGHFPTLQEAEDLLMTQALKASKGNQGIAAVMLGLKRQTLNMRLKVRNG